MLAIIQVKQLNEVAKKVFCLISFSNVNFDQSVL
jgi:hypothetical protein